MLIQIKKVRLINFLFIFIFVITIFLIIFFNLILKIEKSHFQYLIISNLNKNESNKYLESNECLLGNELSSNNWTLIDKTNKKSLETIIECVGSLYNQSCLYQNLYFLDKTFIILTIKGKNLPNISVRTNSFLLETIKPNIRIFDSYEDLQNFVQNIIHPRRIPFVTLYFGQFWHKNIGHALFDGLYPAYLAMIRFSPRHLHPFRILANIDDCKDCLSEDIYNRFGGLGLIKRKVLNKMSDGKWFMFDQLIMGSGTMCQRCIQSNYQLPGGIELNGSRLFRDRIYKQHSINLPIKRIYSSNEYRNSKDILKAFIIHNKRFTKNDQIEISNAINEINTYTNIQLKSNKTNLKNPLIHVFYIYYNQIKPIKYFNLTSINNCKSFIQNRFTSQLKILRKMDIHISGPGTGQMYQTFLSDGSVHINLGGLRQLGFENLENGYTSYLEQYITSGTPYIKALYYPINQRKYGIKKDQLIILIRQAANFILKGFSLPVNPQENLAPDGQLFTEMCQKDKEFCSLVTIRSSLTNLFCLDFWVEDFVHEDQQWKLGGFIHNGKNISCHFNRTLLHQLRIKYRIQHYSDHWFNNILIQFYSLF